MPSSQIQEMRITDGPSTNHRHAQQQTPIQAQGFAGQKNQGNQQVNQFLTNPQRSTGRHFEGEARLSEFHKTHYVECRACGNMTEFTEEGFNDEYLDPLCCICESSEQVPKDYRTPIMTIEGVMH